MTVRARLFLAAGTVAIPVLLSPLLLRPLYAIGLVCAVAGVWLASRGVEYPLTLTAIFSILIAFLGRNPFPHGVISEVGFLWVAVALLLLVLRRPDALPLRVMMSAPVVLTVATAGWMLARLGASASPGYGSQKLQLFVIENLAFLVAGVAVAQGRRSFRTLLVLTFAMAAVSGLVLMRDLVNGTAQAVVGGRLSISSDFDPIIFGRDAARAITIAVFFLLVSRRPGLRLASLAAIPVLAVAFTSAGSRGPALSLVVGLVVLLAGSLRDRAARRRVLLVAGGGLLAAFLVAQLAPGQNVSRTLSFLTGNSADTSSNGRTDLWSSAWHLFTAHPLLGVGTGGYRAVEPVYIYPHNLFLETLAELGLVGGLLVAGTIVLGAGRLARVWRAGDATDRQDVSMVGALLAAAFVNAMFSGDVTTNSALWLSVGLAVGLGRRVETAGGMRLPRVRPRRREAPTARRRIPAHGPQTVPPRIVSPAAGSELGGPVEVRVAPPRTGSPVALVRLEWERGERLVVAESDQRAFEVSAGTGAAVVRSRWLAEVVAAALGTTAEPSRRRPWAPPRHYVLWWDAAELGDGLLRAVAVDEQGREVESDPVRLRVVPAETAAVREGEAEAERRRAAGRLEELRLASVGRDDLAARVERAEAELQAAQEKLRAAVAGRDESVARLEATGRERERVAAELQAVRDELRLALAGREELDTRASQQLQSVQEELRAAVAGRDESAVRFEAAEREREQVAAELQAVRGELRLALAGREELDTRASQQLQSVREELRAAVAGRDELAVQLERRVAERDDLSARLERAERERNELGSRMSRAASAAAARHRELARELQTAEEERDRLAAELAGLEEGRAKAAPAPAAAAAAPAPRPVEWAPARRPNLRDLERRAASERDPYRQAKLEALVFHLAAYAEQDGTLPEQFDELVAQELGR